MLFYELYSDNTICSGLEIPAFMDSIIMYRSALFNDPPYYQMTTTPLGCMIIIGNEWVHIISKLQSNSRDFIINRNTIISKSHIGCSGKKYVFALKNAKNGVYVRNYRSWVDYIKEDYIWNSAMGLYTQNYYARHFYKFDEAGEIKDYGESALNIIENTYYQNSLKSDFYTVSNMFPYDLKGPNYTQLHNGGMFFGNDSLVLPNIIQRCLSLVKKVTFTFWIKLEQNLSSNSYGANIMKVINPFH
jgi:hypothetical protein